MAWLGCAMAFRAMALASERWLGFCCDGFSSNGFERWLRAMALFAVVERWLRAMAFVSGGFERWLYCDGSIAMALLRWLSEQWLSSGGSFAMALCERWLCCDGSVCNGSFCDGSLACASGGFLKGMRWLFEAMVLLFAMALFVKAMVCFKKRWCALKASIGAFQC